MKVYLSHARKDTRLALQLAEQLESAGFTVFHPHADVVPGENWATKVGKALNHSEFMVFLLTPGATDIDAVRNDVEFAMFSRQFEKRVFSVIVAATYQAGKDVPWILMKLPHEQVASAKEFAGVVKEIARMASEESSVNR